MGNTLSAAVVKNDTWSILISLNQENMNIYYTINSSGKIEKRIVSEGKEVIFTVDTEREMFDVNKSRVGRDGNFSEFSYVVNKLVKTLGERWTTLALEKEVPAKAVDFEWVITVEMPSEVKHVTYTITFDNELLVKKVSCSATQLSNVFTVHLGGSMFLGDVFSGQDGEHDKLVAVLASMIEQFYSY